MANTRKATSSFEYKKKKRKKETTTNDKTTIQIVDQIQETHTSLSSASRGGGKNSDENCRLSILVHLSFQDSINFFI